MHLSLLIATLLALLSGPLIYAGANQRPRLLHVVDLLILVSVGALLIVEVLPSTFSNGGWWSGIFLMAGLLGPTVIEHLLSKARRGAHIVTLTLAIVGLVLHATGDGVALSPATGEEHEALGIAVAIHSIPVGLLVWWLLYPVFGFRLPAAAILAMCAGTVAGYVFGVPLNHVLGIRAWAWFQALVAGSILHVVLGRPHLQANGAEHQHH